MADSTGRTVAKGLNCRWVVQEGVLVALVRVVGVAVCAYCTSCSRVISYTAPAGDFFSSSFSGPSSKFFPFEQRLPSVRKRRNLGVHDRGSVILIGRSFIRISCSVASHRHLHVGRANGRQLRKVQICYERDPDAK